MKVFNWTERFRKSGKIENLEKLLILTIRQKTGKFPGEMILGFKETYYFFMFGIPSYRKCLTIVSFYVSDVTVLFLLLCFISLRLI